MPIVISLPIFLIVAAGWFMKKIKIVDDQWIKILNAFTYYVSLPAIIISSLWDINLRNIEFIKLIIFSLLSFAFFAAVIFLVLHFLPIDKKSKAAIFLASTAGNTVYMGFPIIESVLGKSKIPSAAVVSIIYLIPSLILSIFIVRLWYNKEHSVAKELYAFIKNPLVISSIIGIFLSMTYMSGEVVLAVKKTFSLLGATASPTALFILGAFLYGKFLKKDLHLVVFSVILKMIVFPILVLMTYFYIYKPFTLKVPFILSAMPVAVTAFVIAEKFDLDSDLIGNSILISTAVSFVLIPFLINLL